MKRLFYFTLLGLFVMQSCLKNQQEEPKPAPPSPLVDRGERIVLQSGAIVYKKGNLYTYEGDILLSEAQVKLLAETGHFFPKDEGEMEEAQDFRLTLNPATNTPIDGELGTKAHGIYPTPYNLWAMVRYRIDPGFNDWYDNLLLQNAIAHIEANTNVRFYNATGEPTHDPVYGFEYPCVVIQYGTVNQSYIGRVELDWYVGQPLYLARIGGLSYFNEGTIIHELYHAIGLIHEHNRYDRDTYIDINWSNLKPAGADQFDLRTNNYYIIGGLDTTSIMIYPSLMTDTNMVHDPQINTITWKGTNATWRRRDVLSDLDRRWANTLYVPYVARPDTYRELAPIVYKPDNTIMTPAERCALQAELNFGQMCPPENPGCCF